MLETHCIICRSGAESKQIFPQSADVSYLTGTDFTARKKHTKCHYRIVACTICGLIRSNPILDENTISDLYSRSDFSYDGVAPYLANTYLSYGGQCISSLTMDAKILDVGCGNGFFLEKLWAKGFRSLAGYEPSESAIRQAVPHIRPLIRKGMFDNNFAATGTEQYDFITFFHVLDHVSRPDVFLDACMRSLKPGGVIYGVTHNIDSPVHRLFGEHSVIYDIQHIYLFSLKTIRLLLEMLGFRDIRTMPIVNTFPLWYFFSMSPLPRTIKNLFRTVKFLLPLPVGNMAFIAKKPLQ